jgi:hypothetical protein
MGLARVVCGGVVFLAAFLLFAVEPMAAKQLLPVLGGSSAVWVTCLVFFQGMLLAGYGYAHWLSRGRRRVWVHMVLLMVAVRVVFSQFIAFALILMLGMPYRLTHGNPTDSLHPVSTIFRLLGTTIGLPFLVLSATSPLVQVWWARREGGAVPYRLFALSNAGSLLALVCYPLVIEPRLTLAAQRGWWGVGFCGFAVGCAWLAWRIGGWRTTHRVEPDSVEPDSMDAHRAGILHSAPNDKRSRPPATTRWMWFLLPMGAAMQLCAVTSHLSQDVAAIPLLWVLPLGVYLATFILAFEMPGLYRRWLVARLLAVMLASLGYALSKVDTALPIGVAIAFYLLEVLVAGWFCHAEAYRLRPRTAEDSTAFYLMVSAGGVTGTFLIAIASPLLFRSNYDLALSFLVTAALAALVTWRDGWAQRLLWVTGSGLLLALAVLLHVQFARHAQLRARNFYGSLRVTEGDIDPGSEGYGTGAQGEYTRGTGPVRTLTNGRIRHGLQMMEADRRRTPTTYYAEDSGAGVAMRECCAGRAKYVGVVGLGAGTLAAYGRAGDRMRFYEINPLVEPIARNLFTFLGDSSAAISVAEGDGRALLEREDPQRFDVLVVDAFSGDAIPLHLLTREAMQVYRRQLAPGGVMAFHVSNSYLDLAPEIRRLADSVDMEARLVESAGVPSRGEYRATWVLVSADAGFFARPGVAVACTRIPEQPGLPLWTDDYSSLLAVMRWGR